MYDGRTGMTELDSLAKSSLCKGWNQGLDSDLGYHERFDNGCLDQLMSCGLRTINFGLL